MYYVRFYAQSENGYNVRYITKHCGSYLEWKEEEKPLPMCKAQAEECFYRLAMNGATAEIIYQLDNMADTHADGVNGWLHKLINKAIETFKKERAEKEKKQ